MVASAVAEGRGMVWEALPSTDGPDVGAGDDWERAGVAERLSAAGAAPAAADVSIAGDSAAPQRGEARVNPPGHVWVSTVSRALHAKRLEELWQKWQGNEVDDDGDGVSREELDPWQKFAHDIAVFKATERERLSRGSVPQLSNYHPLRLMLTGDAGSGKSRTLRASVRSMRGLVAHRGAAVRKNCCKLAAPTGCASFHMKYNATTAHRLWGLRAFGHCGRLSSQSKALPVIKARLKGARTLLLDEWSMLGKVFVGKMLLRARDVLGLKPEG